MQVKEIDINTGKIKGYGICKKKYKISFLGGPTTPTYSNTKFIKLCPFPYSYYQIAIWLNLNIYSQV